MLSEKIKGALERLALPPKTVVEELGLKIEAWKSELKYVRAECGKIEQSKQAEKDAEQLVERALDEVKQFTPILETSGG
jgi:hypothetical protein